LSKQNLKIFNKIKGLTKDQLKEYINILRDVSINLPEKYFGKILSMKKTEQLRAIKDIILSLNSDVAEESFNTYEDNLTETSMESETALFYKVNDIDTLKNILHNACAEIQSYEIEHITINGFKAFLKYHALQLPDYMVNDVLASAFSINVVNTQEISDNTKYFHELLGLDFLKESIIIFFGQMELNLRLVIVTGFYIWEKFENKLNEYFKNNNEYLFLPEEEIGTFELEIYNTLVSILEEKLSNTNSPLDVFMLIERIYNIARSSTLVIEPWKEYLYG